MNWLLHPVGKSFVLHLVLGTVLVVSVHFSPTPQLPESNNTAQPINAVVVDAAVINQQLQKIEQEKQQKLEADRRKKEEQQRRIREREEDVRRAEQAAAEARKRKQEEQKRAAAEAERKKREAAEKAKREKAERERKERERKEAERKKAEAEKKRKEAEQKAKEEAERKAQEALEKAEQERILEEQLKVEQAARNARRQRQVMSEIGKYTALIEQTIKRNWIVDPSMKGKSCRLNIRLASNGLVTQVTTLEGDANVCRSAHSAVLKSDTLPVSSDPEVFAEMKEINLTLKP
ncbi:cell envelope integrity protein TolA [Planctobacterium marinum]|uniref:TolA protein n=1 Tax=Planctobacterium marinum TaxID=1631968 RepID=A0AA48HSR2_9ALTE|nr:hypothetical protein MACH26_28250 [Planctobacterium marinum]